MTTKRTLLRRRPKPVMSEALELYRRGVEIIEQGADEAWEEEGGRRREFGEIDVALQDRLGRRPWEWTIFEVDDGDPPPHRQSQVDDWYGAQRLRRQLQSALDARRRGQAAGVPRAP